MQHRTITEREFCERFLLEPASPCPKYHSCKLCRSWAESHTFRGSREKFFAKRQDLRAIVEAFEPLLGKFNGRTISYRGSSTACVDFDNNLKWNPYFQSTLHVARGKRDDLFVIANDNFYTSKTPKVIDIALTKTSARVVKFWYSDRTNPNDPGRFLAKVIR